MHRHHAAGIARLGHPLAPRTSSTALMAALSPKWRALVMEMASNPLGTHANWARAAGYSAKAGLRVRAFEVYHDPKVQSAIMEVARNLMGAEGPLLAVTGLLATGKNPKHQSHAKVLELLANRVGFSEKQQIAPRFDGRRAAGAHSITQYKIRRAAFARNQVARASAGRA